MKKNEQPTNSDILNPQPGIRGFVVGDWDDPVKFFAAVPYGKKLAIVNGGRVIKVCRNEETARKFIQKCLKSRKTKKTNSKENNAL